MRSHLLALFLVAAVAPCVNAQSERYELAARLKAFEAEWEKQTNKDARKRAVKVLPDMTSQFLRLQLGKNCKALDDARFALMNDKPQSDVVVWATSLHPEVEKRYVTGDRVEVDVKQLYKVKATQPKGVSIRAGFDGKTWTTAEVDKLPVTLGVPLPENFKWPIDLTLTVEVVSDGKVLASRTVGVSAFDKMSGQMMALMRNAPAITHPVPLVSETCKGLVALLNDFQDGTVPESDVPVATLYSHLFEHFSRQDVVAFGPDTPGDHRISVPTGEQGKIVTPCRLFVPEKLNPKTPVPLVVAMHGAGGSENMFFEGYGNGHIVKLCKERGWLLVSPRAGIGFGLTPAPLVGDIVDELAKWYPVDAKRVFILGHSMGSSMAFDAVQRSPGKFAAVACLGGGGSVRKAEVFAELPVFIGVGDKDFAVKTAKGLQANLEKAKAKNVTFKEYPDVEHLVIVREALGDVFDLFGKVK